ncbi:MAG: exodeoxyribonuclease VII small subunit [Opitutales bacterium]
MVSEEKQEKKDPRFEDALTRLESIIESMEDGEIPLDEVIVKYEEGVQLLKACQTRLREAELKIEEVKQKGGVIETTPFESDGTE